MPFKFENLDVYHLALDYVDLAYEIASLLPASEEYNLKSQLKRAATSVVLNIAEGSTGQTDNEQARFLGMAIRSLLETVACQQIIRRRKYLSNSEILEEAYQKAEILAAKLHAFRKAIDPDRRWVRELDNHYITDDRQRTEDK